jgi:hypothetical protein
MTLRINHDPNQVHLRGHKPVRELDFAVIRGDQEVPAY